MGNSKFSWKNIYIEVVITFCARFGSVLQCSPLASKPRSNHCVKGHKNEQLPNALFCCLGVGSPHTAMHACRQLFFNRVSSGNLPFKLLALKNMDAAALWCLQTPLDTSEHPTGLICDDCLAAWNGPFLSWLENEHWKIVTLKAVLCMPCYIRQRAVHIQWKNSKGLSHWRSSQAQHYTCDQLPCCLCSFQTV